MDLDQKIPRSRTKKITTFNSSTWRGNISLQCKHVNYLLWGNLKLTSNMGIIPVFQYKQICYVQYKNSSMQMC